MFPSTIWNQSNFGSTVNDLPSICTDQNYCYVAYQTDTSATGGTKVGGTDIVLSKIDHVTGQIVWVKQDNKINNSTISNTNPIVKKSSSNHLYVLYDNKESDMSGNLIISKINADNKAFVWKSEYYYVLLQSYDLYVNGSTIYVAAVIIDNQTDSSSSIKVYQVNPSNGSFTLVTTLSDFTYQSVAVTVYQNYMYVLTGYNNVNITVVKINLTTGLPDTSFSFPSTLINLNTKYIGGIVCDTTGNVIISYQTDGTGNQDVVVAKLNGTDGSLIKVIQPTSINTSNDDGSINIDIDSYNNIYITFYYNDEFITDHSIVFKLNSNLDIYWSKDIANDNNFPNNGRYPSIAVDANQEIFLAYKNQSDPESDFISVDRIDSGITLSTPSGLQGGDKYRFVFVTSGTRDATSSNIDDYNSFVQQNAFGAVHKNKLVQWKVIGSTNDTIAETNLGGLDQGIKIFLVDGSKIYDNLTINFFNTYYTTTLGYSNPVFQHPINKNILLYTINENQYIWSGFTTNYLGGDDQINFGNINNIHFGNSYPKSISRDTSLPFYAMSETFTVPYDTTTEINGPVTTKLGTNVDVRVNVNYVTQGVSEDPVVQPLQSLLLGTNYSISALFSIGIVFIPSSNTSLKKIKLYVDKATNSGLFAPKLSLYSATNSTPYFSYASSVLAEDICQTPIPGTQDFYAEFTDDDLKNISAIPLVAGTPYALIVKMSNNVTFGVNGTSVIPFSSNDNYTTNSFQVINTIFNNHNNYSGSRIAGIYLFSSDRTVAAEGSVTLQVNQTSYGPSSLLNGCTTFTVTNVSSTGTKDIYAEYTPSDTNLYNTSSDTSTLTVLPPGVTIQGPSTGANCFSLVIEKCK